jgi:hypothetical protein
MKLGQVTDGTTTKTMVGKSARSLVTTLNTFSPEATSSIANGSTNASKMSGNSGHESGGRRRSVEEMLFGKKSKSEANISGSKETLTGSIEFLSMQKSNTITRELSTADFVQPSSYKLIDLGTAVGVHEDEDIQKAESLMTMTEMAFAG